MAADMEIVCFGMQCRKHRNLGIRYQPTQKLSLKEHTSQLQQTVPKGAKKAFAEVAANCLRHYVATGLIGGADHKQARAELLLLPSRLLHNANGSRRRKSEVQSNIRRYQQGQAPDPQVYFKNQSCRAEGCKAGSQAVAEWQCHTCCWSS
jgi:hypothetical protein